MRNYYTYLPAPKKKVSHDKTSFLIELQEDISPLPETFPPSSESSYISFLN